MKPTLEIISSLSLLLFMIILTAVFNSGCNANSVSVHLYTAIFISIKIIATAKLQTCVLLPDKARAESYTIYKKKNRQTD